jgi:hypothetical protein
VLSQSVQVFGSVLVLSGFVLSQRGVLDGRSAAYLNLNLVGAALLAIDGVVEHQWGFVLLEGVWALVSWLQLLSLPKG